MYDPTFGAASLARHIKKSDFRDYSDLKVDVIREGIIANATSTAHQGFMALPLVENNLAGRKIFQVTDLSSELVLRKAAQNLRRITGAKQSSRLEIVRRLRLFCEEGIPFTIAKMDIKNFYPSIDHTLLSNHLRRRLMTAPSTRRVLTSLLDQCRLNSIEGVPPGLAISAELSELYLQDFDAKVRDSLKTHYYARYVDDIILVLPEVSCPKKLRNNVESFLPDGLHLNLLKSKVFQYSGALHKVPSIEASFDYLGYKFIVHQTQRQEKKPHDRKVNLDIAQSKVKKNKTRICNAFLQYIVDGNFADLRDRLRILSCSYPFYDERKSKQRGAGILHTYGMIELGAPALTELDRFLKAMIVRRSGKIGTKLAVRLSNRERKELLCYSFVNAFSKKTHFRFSPNRLAHLMECWKYA